MRPLSLILMLLPAPALAEAWHDLGRPEQCGDYTEAGYDRQSWFPGGEGALITLTDPQPLPGVNAVSYAGVVTEEGASDPAGTILAARGPLLVAGGTDAPEVLVIVTEAGIRLLQPCP